MSLLAVVLFFFYGGFIEPRWIEVTNWSRSVGLFGKTITLAQLSDLHISEISTIERKTLEHIKELQPQIILLSGDVIDRHDSLPALKSFLAQIQAPMLPFGFAKTEGFTALVFSSVSMCSREQLLRLSTHGSCVLFFMFKTDRRAGKVKKTQTPPLAPIVTVSPQR
jgi:hypothetical protein